MALKEDQIIILNFKTVDLSAMLDLNVTFVSVGFRLREGPVFQLIY
jgi:hypothetical protein